MLEENLSLRRNRVWPSQTLCNRSLGFVGRAGKSGGGWALAPCTLSKAHFYALFFLKTILFPKFKNLTNLSVWQKAILATLVHLLHVYWDLLCALSCWDTKVNQVWVWHLPSGTLMLLGRGQHGERTPGRIYNFLTRRSGHPGGRRADFWSF